MRGNCTTSRRPIGEKGALKSSPFPGLFGVPELAPVTMTGGFMCSSQRQR
jgi:hypothetical protein